MTVHKKSLTVGAAALLAASLGACRYTGFQDPTSRTASTSATTWLTAQQKPDGGFELAGFPGFETADAVIAIAEEAQTTDTWDHALALSAVQGVQNGGNDALDALDDYADGTIDAGAAAKLTVLVALPLGLSPTAFDPQSDGSKDLIATIDAGLQANGSYGSFGATLMAAIAKKTSGSTVPATTEAFIRAAQKADGSWDYLGDPSGTGSDIDTTAQAINALVAAGATHTDTDLVQALTFLADKQSASGAWQSFGSDDPNSTATATLAVTGAGYDPSAAAGATSSPRDARARAMWLPPAGWLPSKPETATSPVPTTAGG